MGPMMRVRTRRGVLPWIAVAAAVFCCRPDVAADTYPRQPGVDARHYAVRLTLLTGDSNEIQAEATVTLRVVVAGTREASRLPPLESRSSRR